MSNMHRPDSRNSSFDVVHGHHPLVFGLASIMRALRVSETTIARRSGIHQTMLGSWRRGTNPGLMNFDSVLRTLGFRLVIAPIGEEPDSAPISRKARE